MTRYRLVLVLLLLAAAQLVLPYEMRPEPTSLVGDTVGAAGVGLVLLYFFLRGSRVAYALLLVGAAGSAVGAAACVLLRNGSPAYQSANMFLDAAAAVLIWMIWQETVAARDSDAPSPSDANSGG